MTHIVQYICAITIGLLGIICIIYSQLQLTKTKNDYDKITAAMNANTSKGNSCSPGGKPQFCNSVAPATWLHNKDVAKMFYTKNEVIGTAKPSKKIKDKKSGGKWNINSGPSWTWGPAPIHISPPSAEWYNQVAIIESANNLGNALGTLTARKNDYQLWVFNGIVLVVFSLIFAIASYYNK